MAARYPRGSKFLKKAFHQFFTNDTISWFAQRGVAIKAEPDGRMFPVTDSSQSIIDCLLHEAQRSGVTIRMQAEVTQIQCTAEGFRILLRDQTLLPADFVTVACGGYPKAAMFDWLQELGHPIQPPVPSLFTFNIPQHPIVQLMGVAVKNAQVKINGTKLREQGPVLITHWGLSGPAVLRLSAWGARILEAENWHFTVQVNWLPDFNEETLRVEIQQLRNRLGGQKVMGKNPYGLPVRLWDFLAAEAGIGEQMRWADVPAREQNRLVKNLSAYELQVKGKTTYKEEFVTAGGVELSTVDPGTMMSRLKPDLFFAGEILDVDGITGGFNFQNAWTTGYIAARTIAIRTQAEL